MTASHADAILVVEDDPIVLELLRKLLERADYRVLTATSGEDALSVAAAHRGAILLVIADIVLPRMSGRELVERLKQTRLDLRALYMSGYEPAMIARHGLAEPTIPLLEKPFTPQAVMRRVREALA